MHYNTLHYFTIQCTLPKKETYTHTHSHTHTHTWATTHTYMHNHAHCIYINCTCRDMGGWMDGRTDGRTEGRMDVLWSSSLRRTPLTWTDCREVRTRALRRPLEAPRGGPRASPQTRSGGKLKAPEWAPEEGEAEPKQSLDSNSQVEGSGRRVRI